MRCIHKQDCVAGALYIIYIPDVSNIGMPLCMYALETVCTFHTMCDFVVKQHFPYFLF